MINTIDSFLCKATAYIAQELPPGRRLIIERVQYVALASIVLGLSVAVCFCPPVLAAALGTVATLVSMRLTLLYYQNNPGDILKMLNNVKFLALRVLSIFSQSHQERADAVSASQNQPGAGWTAKKVALFILSAISFTLFVASYFVAPPVAVVFTAIIAGIAFVRWTDHLNTVFFETLAPETL